MSHLSGAPSCFLYFIDVATKWRDILACFFIFLFMSHACGSTCCFVTIFSCHMTIARAGKSNCIGQCTKPTS